MPANHTHIIVVPASVEVLRVWQNATRRFEIALQSILADAVTAIAEESTRFFKLSKGILNPSAGVEVQA